MAKEIKKAPVATSGENTEEDWQIFQALCQDAENSSKMNDEIDVTTSLRSELAALQYKRDRLTSKLAEMHSQIRARDQRCLDLQLETDQLREQAARQQSIVASLKQRVHEQEERERELVAAQSRSDIQLHALQRDGRYQTDRANEMEKKIHALEVAVTGEEQKKDALRLQLQDLVRRLAMALGVVVDFSTNDCNIPSAMSDALVHKAAELVQETTRLRMRASNINDNLATTDMELHNCREKFERSCSEKDMLQRQLAVQTLETDRLRQEKESLDLQYRVIERELNELKEKLTFSNRSLGSASGNIVQQENTIGQLKEELKARDEKIQRIQNENRLILESLAIILSTPSRFVESSENSIKDGIREILNENQEKTAQLETIKDKLNHESQQLSRQITLYDQATVRIRALEDEKNHLETRLHKADAEINASELSRDGLKRDKTTFMNFLDRLARALNMDDISHDIGVDLHTESLLLRAEQLARLESEKLVDKLLCCGYRGTLPRLRRERTCHDIPVRETALVYQLQRRVRTLREQVQRKDLHLDLLRRKLTLQEDTAKTKCLLQNERDESNMRVKKLIKQIDRLQMQLNEAKLQIRELNSQLAEAADYKITALERGRKIEDLQKRLIESETLRTKYNRKVTLLKDQVRTTGNTIEQERNINEHSLQLLRDELARIKDDLTEAHRRDVQLQNFKGSVAKILGVALPMPDYELISRLQKLVDAHHDFTLVSRRYDDPVLRLATRSPTIIGGSRCTRTPDRSRYDDSGYTDAVDIIDDIVDDDLFKSRQGRSSML